MAIVNLRNAEAGEPRLQALALAQAPGVERSALDAGPMIALFDIYYDVNRNSATLPAFAALLDQLPAGELLSPGSTRHVLDHMRAIPTGGQRISAGRPAGADFAQKTGTRIRRACNVGGINSERARGATRVPACEEDFEGFTQAATAFQGLGRALGETVLDVGGGWLRHPTRLRRSAVARGG